MTAQRTRPNGDRRQEDEDPEERIAQPVDVELHALREYARRREFLSDAAEVGQRLVGDDH